jgi:AcrR family transcriptional regulator
MGRPKTFSREEVLQKALPVFWKHGYADTSVQELERATGVNKSGLYSEFAGKEDLFLQSLRYYLDTRQRRGLLEVQPLGWENIEHFLKFAPSNAAGQKGCFSISSLRELAILPPEAATIMARSRARLKQLLVDNITAARPKPDMSAEELAELALTFFTGISTEQNLNPTRATLGRRIDNFMKMLRQS